MGAEPKVATGVGLVVLLGCAVGLAMVADNLPARSEGLPADIRTATEDDLQVVVQGTWGDAPGQFGKIDQEGRFGPNMYVVDGRGRLVLWDWRYNRLQVFDQTGKLFSVVDKVPPALTAMAVDYEDHLYLTDGTVDRGQLWEVSLPGGPIRALGEPQGVFTGIAGFSTYQYFGHIEPAKGTAPSQAPINRLLLLHQFLDTLEGTQEWVVAYDLSLKPVAMVPGRGQAAGFTYFYIVQSPVVKPDQISITLKRTTGLAPVTETPPLEFSLPIANDPRRPYPNVKLLGVSNDSWFTFFTFDGIPKPVRHVWKYDLRGNLLGVVTLSGHLTLPGQSYLGTTVVAPDGTLYVSWAERDKGFYVGKIPAYRQWGTPGSEHLPPPAAPAIPRS